MKTTTTTTKQLESNNNIYNVSDNIRVMLKSNTTNNNEYIGTISDITDNSITIMFNTFTNNSGKNYKRNISDIEYKTINIDDILKVRLADLEENFDNQFTF